MLDFGTVMPGKTPHMHFINNGILQRDIEGPVPLPVEIITDNATPAAEKTVSIHAAPSYIPCPPFRAARYRPDIGIEKEIVAGKKMAAVNRIVRPDHTVTIT